MHTLWSLSRNLDKRRHEHLTESADVFVIIPAWNEEGSIGRVIDALPKTWHRRVVVADNNSTDYTADVARKFGATVIPAPRQGYGSACLAALAYVAALPEAEQPRIVAFIDADFSDHPEQLPLLVEPVLAGRVDFVIGSRARKRQPPGAMLPQARFGNALACFLIRILFGQRYTDLGPFRAIAWPRLRELNMSDTDFGWTVEMQIKAAQRKLRIMEVAVDYRSRIGYSKISGTLRGTVLAGYKILWTIIRHGLGRGVPQATRGEGRVEKTKQRVEPELHGSRAASKVMRVTNAHH